MKHQHKSEIVYTLDDDGIWLICNCGFKFNANFCPTIEKINNAWKKHLQSLDGEQ